MKFTEVCEREALWVLKVVRNIIILSIGVFSTMWYFNYFNDFSVDEWKPLVVLALYYIFVEGIFRYRIKLPVLPSKPLTAQTLFF